MKRFQSILFTSLLVISLSGTALAGDITGVKGDITGVKGDITGVKGDITGLLTWGDITGVVVSIFGNIHG